MESNNFSFEPTPEQAQVLELLMQFVHPDSGQEAFVLSGAAGTGKTSLMQALVRYLDDNGIDAYLAAPTARAAHILSSKTGWEVRTIHSMIYRAQSKKNEPGVVLSTRYNPQESFAVYIVDEASMVSDRNRVGESGLFEAPGALLADLIQFMRQEKGGFRVVFLGDQFQLPPVGEEHSPALDPGYLQRVHGLKTQSAELKQVMRQSEGSALLALAHNLRTRLGAEGPVRPEGRRGLTPVEDVFHALRRFRDGYDPDREDQAVFIARSNKRVNWLNAWARKVMYMPDDALLLPGERVVLEASWIGGERIVYRGDSGVVLEVSDEIESYAKLQFAEARVAFKDGFGEPFVAESKVLLNILSSERGMLSWDQEKFLHHQVISHNRKFREDKHPRNDPYIGALRLRHGYALTCNKAQGGEWNEVMLDPFFPKDAYRWMYTAVTRARERLFSWPNSYDQAA